MEKLTIEQLKAQAEKYFEEVIKIMKETPEGSAEYDSHVEDLEAMSVKMSDDSFGYLKLKVVY
jgi:hypothetical protein